MNIYFLTRAYGEEVGIECWVLCQPDSYVNVRAKPKKTSEEVGYFECGAKILTDGKVKNGYLHIFGFMFEVSEGWIHKGYIVYDEPYFPIFENTTIESNGRVAARRTVNGEKRCWLKNGQAIKVYMVSDEWSVTNKGFVKTKFIDLGR
jgi:hypothetical protein